MCSLPISAPPEVAPSPLAGLPTEQLERQITELAAHINAATCRWLELVGEFDRRESWADWGCKSCGHWLSYCCGISLSTAREQVRVARALDGLPTIRAAFARGELCYSQVRALTRVATVETEAELATMAHHATAGQLETIVRAYRGVLEVELGPDDPAHRRRFVHCEHDDDGSLVIRARLPAEEGALVLKALESGRDELRRVSAETTQTGDSEDGSQVSNADALLLMADTLLSGGTAERTGGDRYEVVVHVDAATLGSDEPGSCELEAGPALHPETARRLSCDSSVVRILEHDGRPLSVGRRTRSVPPALRRALRTRDGCCRFPGCGQRRFLHAHHVEHWARGGRTDLSNLIQLCAFHHRLVHEGGFGVEGDGCGEVRFRRPDGLPVPYGRRRARGNKSDLMRANRRAELRLDHETCVPRVNPERMQLGWVIDALVQVDPRLRE